MIQGNKLAIAGAAAEGSGALTGWSGLGSLKRSEIIECLIEADLPTGWAPRSKSNVGYAGAAITALKSLGYITRRARAAKWHTPDPDKKSERKREYQARWIVAANTAMGAEVGDAVGNVILTVELTDTSDDLIISGDEMLATRIKNEYESARDAEIYRAGEVTTWLRSVLIRECGSARYAMGYFVPSEGRDIAQRLIASVAGKWGANWANPLLPVASSNELKIGIARGFSDEVANVAKSLQVAREDARNKDKDEISARKAAGLLKELADVDSRADAYRVLCGDTVLADAIKQLRSLHTTLTGLSDDTSQRFALLELNETPDTPTVDESSPELIQAALASRKAEVDAESPKESTPAGEPISSNGSSERFSLIEMT